MILFKCKHDLKDVPHFKKQNCIIRHVVNQQSNVTSLLPLYCCRLSCKQSKTLWASMAYDEGYRQFFTFQEVFDALPCNIVWLRYMSSWRHRYTRPDRPLGLQQFERYRISLKSVHESSKVFSCRREPPWPPGYIPLNHLLEAESTPRP